MVRAMIAASAAPLMTVPVNELAPLSSTASKITSSSNPKSDPALLVVGEAVGMRAVGFEVMLLIDLVVGRGVV